MPKIIVIGHLLNC